MKKLVLALVLVCALVFQAAALDIPLSAGGGFGVSFLTHKTTTTTTTTILGTNVTSTEYPKNQMNLQGFFDARFALFRLSYGFKVGDATRVYTSSSSTTITVLDYTYQALDIDLYLKYPFVLNRQCSVFPALGLRWAINLDQTGKADLDETEKADLNDWYLLMGAGADWQLAKNLYLRVLGTYGLNLSAVPSDYSETTYVSSVFYGHAISVDLLVGYRFK